MLGCYVLRVPFLLSVLSLLSAADITNFKTRLLCLPCVSSSIEKRGSGFCCQSCYFETVKASSPNLCYDVLSLELPSAGHSNPYEKKFHKITHRETHTHTKSYSRKCTSIPAYQTAVMRHYSKPMQHTEHTASCFTYVHTSQHAQLHATLSYFLLADVCRETRER